MVAGTLGGDGQAVELARQADGEVADVDHFLHFAQAFLGDLAGLPGHQLAQLRLARAQLLAEQAHQFAPPGRRHLAPGVEGVGGAADLLLHLGGALQVHGTQAATVDGGMDDQFAVLIQPGVDAEFCEQCGNHGDSCAYR
ncbi:hypothetical protein D3C78_894290 [compost metagenome]